MPDSKQLQFLINALENPSARPVWRKLKKKARRIDLGSADLTGRVIRDFDLSGVNLSTAIMLDVDLSGSDLSGADLTNADLRGAKLNNCQLNNANLSRANLEDAFLIDASITKAKLKTARCQGASFVGADLGGTDLGGADLRGANLKFASLTNAKLEGCNVFETDMTGVVMDDSSPGKLINFDYAKIDDRKYRVMRWRLGQKNEVAIVEKTGTELTSTGTGAGKVKARLDMTSGDEKILNKGRILKPKVDTASSIPLWDTPPDLDTIEGCCAVLDIPSDADMRVIVKAFRKRAMILHPDKVSHLSTRLQNLAAEEFRRVRTAYENLTRGTARPLTNLHWAEGVPHYDSPYEYTAEQFEKLAAVNPGNINILYNLAWKYFEEGRMAEALSGYERVLQIKPDDTDAAYNIIVVKLVLELEVPHSRLIGSGD